jgi:clan AA aspartic protease (TIGR02281 family)
MIRHGLAFVLAASASAAWAQVPRCESERFYGPGDYAQTTPLARPHAEFTRMLGLAASGNAAQQRSLGVAYESGYMVDACEARARYWYAKAAAADEEAKRWMARDRALAKLRVSPECAAQSCPSYGEGPQIVELYAEGNGHYRTTISINGVMVPALVDTGATFVSMSAATAKTVGLAYEHGRVATMQTANGTKTSRVVTLSSVQVGNIVLHDVMAAVSEVDMPVLLGMSFLGRINVSLKQGSMSLSRPEGGTPVTVEVRSTPPAPAPAEED